MPEAAAGERQDVIEGAIQRVGTELATNEAKNLVGKLPALAQSITGKGTEANSGGEMTNESLEKLDPYSRVAALTAEAMNGPVPGLRADLSSLVPELQRVDSYGEMSRESYSTMARNHNAIIQYALSRGMTPDQVEQARMQIPNNTKGTLAFINRAFEFAGGRSPEGASEAINAAEVIALLIKLVELVILAIQKINEQKSEKVDTAPAIAGELTAEKIIASGMTPEKVKEMRAEKVKEAETTDTEKKKAEGDLATAEKAGPDLAKQKTALDDKLKDLNRDSTNNAEEIITVEAELKKATQAVEDNDKRITELKERVEALGKKAEALKREIAALDAIIALDATVDQVNTEKAKLSPALQKALGEFTLDRTGIVFGKPEGQLHRLFNKKDGEKVSLEYARKGLIEQLQAMTAPSKDVRLQH